jgi:hypothetical protein
VPRGLPTGVELCLFLLRPDLGGLLVADRHELVSDDAVALLPHQLLPLAPITDAGGVVEQPDGLAGLGQCGKLRPARVVLRKQQILAVEDRPFERVRIRAAVHRTFFVTESGSKSVSGKLQRPTNSSEQSCRLPPLPGHRQANLSVVLSHPSPEMPRKCQ